MDTGGDMKIIEQSWQWLQKPENALELIEQAGRTCYKSEYKINPGSAEKFVRQIVKSGHESVLEHVSASVRLITNRGVTHELIRHRIASYSQESSRYCRYSGDLEFIKPVWWEDWSKIEQGAWTRAMKNAEYEYLMLLSEGSRPEQAREVLPNSLKTEIVMTANLRQWRHIFRLRCDKKAHPQIKELMIDLREGFREVYQASCSIVSSDANAIPTGI